MIWLYTTARSPHPALLLDPASHSILSLAMSCSNHALQMVKNKKLQKAKSCRKLVLCILAGY